MTTIRSRGSRWRPPTDITPRAATGRHRCPRDGGWQTYTRHDDVGPDQIILRVAGDVARATVTLSNGRDERLTLFLHPTHPGSEARGAGLSTKPRHPQDRPFGRFGRAAARSPVARLSATVVHADRGYLCLPRPLGPAQARVRCPVGRSHRGCPPGLGVALSWHADRSGAVARRGSRRVCSARSSVARPR